MGYVCAMQFRMATAADAPATARALLAAFPAQRVFAFEGDLGAGKTTLIKALSAELGVAGGTASPSFAIVNEYLSAQGPLYHFDLYRLEHAEELEAIGFIEYVDSGRYCFIEWPGLAAHLLPPGTVGLWITVEGDGARIIHAAERP